MERGSQLDSPSTSVGPSQPGTNAPGPTTSRNWLVILVVALAGALMIFVGIRNAKKGSSIADRAAMVGNVKGKVVALNFWATWCEPCKFEIPWFVDLQKQYGDQGLQIFGVTMDDDVSPAK